MAANTVGKRANSRACSDTGDGEGAVLLIRHLEAFVQTMLGRPLHCATDDFRHRVIAIEQVRPQQDDSGRWKRAQIQHDARRYTGPVMRRWIALLLLVALPLQGLAAAWPGKVPCPMEAQMAEMLAAGEMAAADLPDCCNDADTFAKTGKACKSGQECNVGSFAMPASVLPVRSPQPAVVPVARLMAPMPPDIVALPWRPPASL